MGIVQSCLGRRKAKVGVMHEKEVETYRKIGKEEKVKECYSGVSPKQVLERDDWIRRIQETDIRIAYFDVIYDDIVQAALTGWDELRFRASLHKKSLQSFSIPKERLWSIKSHEVDSTAAVIYPVDASSELRPATCVGDGNCLYRTISTLLFGSEAHHIEIRLRVLLELIDKWDEYLYGNILQEMSTHNVDNLIAYVMQTSMLDHQEDDEQAMKDIIFQTIIPGSYSSILHVYAASNAIHRPIASIYPELTKFAVNRDVLNQLITPLTSDNDSPLHIMWTHTLDTYLDATWQPNHFVPCLDFENHMEQGKESLSCSNTQAWSDCSTDIESNYWYTNTRIDQYMAM